MTRRKSQYVYVITGVDRNGKRFAPITTSNRIHALGINLWRGTVWKKEIATGKRTRLREVYN